MSARRPMLTDVGPGKTTHAGLWLDKYLTDHDDKGQGRWKLVEEVEACPEPALYDVFFRRWRRSLAATGAWLSDATVAGRLIVGLGNESVLETSITLHRTYGVPLIPGSALKGLAASFARRRLDHRRWADGGEAHQIAFGTTELAGFITFFDALYIPGSGHQHQALHADVITVHHPDYYQDQQGQPRAPADWDSPTPVAFLSATGSFLLALAGPDEWLTAVAKILEHALAEEGIGAKTSSGYGRLTFTSSDPSSQPDDPAGAEVARLVEQISQLSMTRVAGGISQYAEYLSRSDFSPAFRYRLAEAIFAKVRQARLERKVAEKPWYQRVVATLEHGRSE